MDSDVRRHDVRKHDAPEPDGVCAVRPGTDLGRHARMLARVHDATLSGDPAPAQSRRLVARSWNRVLAQGVNPDAGDPPGPLGVGEVDALVIRAEEKLIGQAEELVVLVDSSKFGRRTAMIVRPLSAVATIVTDEGIVDADAKMIEEAGVRLVVAPVRSAEMRSAG